MEPLASRKALSILERSSILACNLAASKISSFLREVLSITFLSNAPFFIIWIPEPSSKPASFFDFDVAKEETHASN